MLSLTIPADSTASKPRPGSFDQERSPAHQSRTAAGYVRPALFRRRATGAAATRCSPISWARIKALHPILAAIGWNIAN
jgi:hypothetical protein